MKAFWDEQRIGRLEEKVDRLEKRMDAGFADTRADFRLLLGIVLTMFMTMILGFAGIIAGIFLQLS